MSGGSHAQISLCWPEFVFGRRLCESKGKQQQDWTSTLIFHFASYIAPSHMGFHAIEVKVTPFKWVTHRGWKPYFTTRWQNFAIHLLRICLLKRERFKRVYGSTTLFDLNIVYYTNRVYDPVLPTPPHPTPSESQIKLTEKEKEKTWKEQCWVWNDVVAFDLWLTLKWGHRHSCGQKRLVSHIHTVDRCIHVVTYL